ncbi:MAG: ABC transporter ATP-binding protein [Lachnospiraceae bacterium]
MIELKNINKYYKIGKDKFHALKDVSLKIDDGEIISIEGESGAGKSTLLHIMGLLDSYDGGEFFIDDIDVSKLSDGKRAQLRNTKIGFVMQDFALIPGKSAKYNVMLPLLLSKKHISLHKISQMAEEILEMVGLGSQINKKVNQLSGGQRQRVAIARAVIINPMVILADEPTGALDTETTAQIMELLLRINREKNITVVIVTHSSQVAGYCSRNLHMKDGEFYGNICNG